MSRRVFAFAMLLSCRGGDGDQKDGRSTSGGASSTSSDASDTSTPGDAEESSSDDDGTAAPDDTDSPACTPSEVPCEDELVLDLSLNELVSAGEVVTTADSEGFRTEVDARAGGLPGAPTNPWVYVRFDDDGAHRVDIDDFAALESDAWHIAAKRYSLRLNSGNGGPSCVAAAPVIDASFEEIGERPGVITEHEAFYDDACNLRDDGMGLGAPGYLLTPWWTYPGCVATTGVPFLVDLPDGRALKLVIDSYYASGQATCNEQGTMGSDAGRFVWRWAWLP